MVLSEGGMSSETLQEHLVHCHCLLEGCQILPVMEEGGVGVGRGGRRVNKGRREGRRRGREGEEGREY